MKAAAIQLNSKLDLAKTDKTYYTAPNHPQIVTLPKLTYLAVTDKGSPDSPIFARATEALYKLAYSVKAICKADGCDFTVPKLEGLWWVESEQNALEVPREEWHWKLLIRLPDFAQSDQIEDARRQTIAKK
ncbi:hypothetical protein [Paenibacillus radicis (ex Xue et al. 2023)]|uniref:GyrI-like small molecule binding domain-containing protein n=1 Tax=Paenibacillus radicis (ex Xue et al. 2023) TaxID=2972489 RepID=A0ABT1YHM1_9BACL|nr:hypothetical protein [Paenibacillus radicis (ex Xue et al. 2023)]MCR8632673.1 hypothetical protein [Paenibacillus radicis (ex Xue et al. 2023)]